MYCYMIDMSIHTDELTDTVQFWDQNNDLLIEIDVSLQAAANVTQDEMKAHRLHLRSF